MAALGSEDWNAEGACKCEHASQDGAVHFFHVVGAADEKAASVLPALWPHGLFLGD